MCLHRARPVSYVFCFILVCTAPVAAITWEQCLRNIRLESENNGLYLTNRTWFLPGSISENPLLTLKGCEALCGGPSPHFYDDAGSILNAWVLPALILLTQKVVQNGHGFWDTVYILANPINWFINVLRTVDEDRQCRRLSQYELEDELEASEEIDSATVSWCDRLLIWVGTRRSKETTTQREKRIMAKYLQALALATDVKISDSILLHRTLSSPLCRKEQWTVRYEIAVGVGLDEVGRLSLALIALALYIFQAISAFVVTVGGQWTTVPGGRIALAMFWHWMVAAILLSNTVGSIPTKSICKRMVFEAYARTGLDHVRNALEMVKLANLEENGIELDDFHSTVVGSLRAANQDLDHPSLINGMKAHRRRLRYMFIPLGIIPVLSPVINSLALLWYLPPTGPNCRFFLLMAISAMYIFNAISTSICSFSERKNRIKDLFLATTSTLLIMLSACGLFNSCRCWSGIYNRSEEEAFIAINNNPLFDPLLKKQFPAIFVVCLTFQFISFGVMRIFVMNVT